MPRSSAAKAVKAPKFSLLEYKQRFIDLAGATDQRTLAIWAIDCTERAMHYFEDAYPDDLRPRHAIETLQAWLNTGEFSMKVIRGASLGAHAAARDVGEDSPARSAARAAGQTVATAHVPIHAVGGAIYVLQAIHRASAPAEAQAAVEVEYEWQSRHLESLRERADQ